MGADTTITITGTIQNAEDYETLVQAIKRSAPTIGWGDNFGLDDEDEIRGQLSYVLGNGLSLDFMENDREPSEFRSIQDTCMEIGLSYVLDVDVDESESVPGSMEIWTPGMDVPLRFIGSEQSGGPFIPSKDLLPLVEAGNWEEITRMVRLSANPSASLPKTLSTAFDLELTRTPSA